MLKASDRRVQILDPLADLMVPSHRGGLTGWTNYEVTTTAPVSTNTKNTTWTQLVASLPRDVYGLSVFCENNINLTGDWLIDIGVGAAAAEVAVLNNLLFSSASAGINGDSVLIPVFIKGGQRLACRCQSSDASFGVVLGVTPIEMRWLARDLLSIETLGANTADSGGVSIDPGGSAGTEGSYSSIGTTTKRWSQFVLAIGGQNNGARTSGSWNCDIAIAPGGAGTEVIIVNDLSIYNNATGDLPIPQFYGPFPCDIPSGMLIRARAKSTITDATDRLFDLVLYGSSPGK